jgi:uncharacterized protein DUF3551
MGLLLRVLGLVAVIVCFEKPARAADQPWCIFKTYTDGYADCRYATLEQCLADRLGSGGSCGPSPYPSAPLRHSPRRS